MDQVAESPNGQGSNKPIIDKATETLYEQGRRRAPTILFPHPTTVRHSSILLRVKKKEEDINN